MKETKSPAEQFAEDYLLVVENDFGAYSWLNELIEEKELDVYAIALGIQDDYEEGMDELIGGTDTVARLIATQLLLGWGVEPFILIARYLVASYEESKVSA